VRTRLLGLLLLVLGCGDTSHSTDTPTESQGGSTAGAAGGAALGSGAGTGGGSVTAPSCPHPLAEWTEVRGTLVDEGVRTPSYIGGAVVVDFTDEKARAAIITVDEQSPEQPGQLTELTPAPPGIATASRDAERVYLMSAATPQQLISVERDGTQRSVESGIRSNFYEGGLVSTGERVVVAARQPDTTLRIETYDTSLTLLSAHEMPRHSASTLKVTAAGVQLATVDTAAKKLQIFALSDGEPELLRSHDIPSSTILIAWAGEGVVLRFDELLYIAADDSRIHVPIPEGDSTSVANLHAAETPFGIAMSLMVDNKTRLALLRDGATEWVDGTPLGVFAELRFDAQSFGAYTVSTRTGLRPVVYFGVRCPE
jgi:hypothetical protein